MQTLSLSKHETDELATITDGEHIVGRFGTAEGGPTLVVFGSIHGNEQSGLIAMKKASEKLREIEGSLTGNVFLLAGNTRAINKNVRHIDADLNRHWTIGNIERNSPSSAIGTNRVEDIEQRELLKVIEGILKQAGNEVFALDLHSTSSESTPFAMIGDTLRNRTFAEMFPATFLLGIEEQLDGTIMEYMNELGAVTLGFEAGQHTTEAAIRNQEALIWLAIVNSGCLPADAIDTGFYEDRLSNAMSKQRIIEIRHRHSITAADEFKMEPGYSNFQKVHKGEVLANDRNGEVKAKETGLVLMPLYQALGNDGFFLGREINRFWLTVSRILRNMKAGRLMKYLPGVSVHPENDLALIVDTGIARVVPLQVFHLLGFRKMRWRDNKLVVSRRRHDTKSPFKTN